MNSSKEALGFCEISSLKPVENIDDKAWIVLVNFAKFGDILRLALKSVRDFKYIYISIGCIVFKTSYIISRGYNV